VPLPEKVPAKVSSEQAGYLTITPVVRQDLSLQELLERILAVTGKDVVRIQSILSRGTLVSGAARYRWERIEAAAEEVRQALADFPDADPDRPFNPAKAAMVLLRGQRGSLELSRDAASEKRWFKRQSFWDVLLPTLQAQAPAYQRYSYSDRADVYLTTLQLDAVTALQAHAGLLKYTTVVDQLRHLRIESAEIYVTR
jgi:hypothetical protein